MAENKFNADLVNETIETARTHYNEQMMAGLAEENGLWGALEGELSLLAECISITVEDHKVCVVLPLKLGKKCLPIPKSIKNGEAGKACISICSTFGIPHGVKVTITILGVVVVSQTFGNC